MSDPIRSADEAARILVELMQTEQMYSLHFECDINVDCVPIVKYTIKRFASDLGNGDEK